MSEQELMLIEHYQSLDAKQKRAFLTFAESLHRKKRTPKRRQQ